MPSKESEIITSKKSQVLIQEKANIIISDKVFNKIKHLCNKFNRVEWSGLIWMDIIGNVEDPTNLKINIIDFTLFDIGTGAYTEFEVTPEIIMAIYDKHPEYIEKKYGCLHSHNSMNVFFSGTDTSTLLEQAFVHNFFVSLIINNDFDKIAKISYKGKKKVEKKEKITFYNRVGNIFLPYSKSVDETTEEAVVYVIDCNVEYENNIPEDKELLDQISIITKLEEKKKVKYDSWEAGKNWHVKKYKSLGEAKEEFDSGFKESKGYQTDLFAEEKVTSSNYAFERKCETFVKRLMCIDYTGDETLKMTMKEAREDFNAYYLNAPRKEYLEEVTEFCEVLLDTVFEKELEANWFEDWKFNTLRTKLAQAFRKTLDLSISIEVDILEIIDLKLKELDDSRKADFTQK